MNLTTLIREYTICIKKKKIMGQKNPSLSYPFMCPLLLRKRAAIKNVYVPGTTPLKTTKEALI